MHERNVITVMTSKRTNVFKRASGEFSSYKDELLCICRYRRSIAPLHLRYSLGKSPREFPQHC